MYAAADGAALFRHLFLGDVVDMARDIVDVADACGAELIVADVMMPGGGLAAELAGLPWASVSCCPVPVLDAYRTFIPEHAVAAFAPGPTREALGLPAGDDRNLLGRVSGRLHLIPTTPHLAGFPELPAQVALVGPLAPLPPEPREAPAGLDVAGLVTHDGTGRPPANVTFLGRVPHDELLDACTAVVTHAGWGTVSRALVRGLPLVLVPISGDQPYIAARCADLGLGIALAAESVTAAGIRDAVRAVIEEPRYRKAALELAAELRAIAPLATASSLISSLPA